MCFKNIHETETIHFSMLTLATAFQDYLRFTKPKRDEDGQPRPSTLKKPNSWRARKKIERTTESHTHRHTHTHSMHLKARSYARVDRIFWFARAVPSNEWGSVSECACMCVCVWERKINRPEIINIIIIKNQVERARARERAYAFYRPLPSRRTSNRWHKRTDTWKWLNTAIDIRHVWLFVTIYSHPASAESYHYFFADVVFLYLI